jgi:hypothetical protein
MISISVRIAPLLAHVTIAALTLVLPPLVAAQGGRGGQPAQTPQEAAAFDLTGYWVSVVTEDWRVRMVTPPKGYYESVPMTAEARRVADAWDPAKDETAGEECKAYGAAAIMRMPGRLRIQWENPTTLRMDIDAGTQTRMFQFGGARPPGGERTWQGQSAAQWVYAATGRGQPRKGSLKVVTTGLRAGYLRRNGVPYSENAVVTEYYETITLPSNEQWMVVTTEVVDPLYLNPPFITSTQFRKQPDSSGWNPTPCTAG